MTHDTSIICIQVHSYYTGNRCYFIINMVYGETGRYPLYINVFARMVSFWAKLKLAHRYNIVNILYKCFCTLFTTNSDIAQNPWFECIQNSFNTCGLSNVFYDYDIVNENWINKISVRNCSLVTPPLWCEYAK